ncbi:ABC transporter substrate-binding protein [Paenibacillus guangzhouensis]|uniref:ABC transporter substrate-binding protein n=1 Tax=Paenibacillus guangzhouensis TaxID=1473112 RepID=UPI001266A238|nr:sugar ABC transporter substrate-binding protein [Paenibacillus guangzhouensis]
MKRIFMLTLLALMVMVAGCSGGGTSSDDGGKTSTSTEGQGQTDSNTTDSKETVTITYAGWGTSGYKDAYAMIVKAFEEKHPNIKIKIEDTPNKQYWQKLETAANGDNLPDVFWMNGPRFMQYAANDMLMPLGTLIKQDNYDMNNYPKSLVDLYTYDGQSYGIPKDFDTIGVWYNKALFDEKKVEYPNASWDWNKMIDAAQKLTDPAKGQWGIAANFDSQGGYYNTIYQAGGYMISDDKKSSGYDKPEAIEGIKFWTDLIHKYKASPTMAQMTDTEALNMFTSGKVAMLWEGSWNAVDFANNDYLKDKIGVAALPKGKQQSVVIHGLGHVMSKNTKHPKEAWEFLKFLGSKEVADIHTKTGVAIPAFNGTQDAWVKSQPNLDLQIFIDQLAYSKPYPVSKYTAKWSGLESDILKKAWSGELSPEEAGKQMAAKMNEALAAE